MIHKISVGPIGENAYIIEEAVVVDPGADAVKIYDKLKQLSPNTKKIIIILTHGHLDHIAGMPDLIKLATQDGLKVTTYAPLGDKVYFGAASKAVHQKIFSDIGSMYFFNKFWTDIPDADYYYDDAFVFPETNIKAIHTPGHTQGSSCLLVGDAYGLISGDTLFRSGRGRTDGFDSDEAAIMKSIRTKLCTLPPTLMVYPGHGDSTTIEKEKMYYI